MPRHIAGALAAVTFLLFTVANASAADWPSLDLPALEAAGNLPEPVDVTVDDPVYHAQKSYTGYPLTAVLVILPQ